MVEELKAFADSEGCLYRNRLDAVRADTIKQLSKFDCFNVGIITRMIDNAYEIHNILEPLAGLQQAPAKAL